MDYLSQPMERDVAARMPQPHAVRHPAHYVAPARPRPATPSSAQKPLKVAIIAESFLPHVNGVSGSVVRILEHCAQHGDEVLVIAPHYETEPHVVDTVAGYPLYRVPAWYPPRITSLPVGRPTLGSIQALKDFDPDVVHFASPFLLGGLMSWVVKKLAIPSVSVYQTDVVRYTHLYRLGFLFEWAKKVTGWIHRNTDITLVPSTSAAQDLKTYGVETTFRWGRGVDTELFHPDRRDERLHRRWQEHKDTLRRKRTARAGKTSGKKASGTQPADSAGEGTSSSRIVVGYVGRLALEKNLQRLAKVAADDRFQVVIIGDGPLRQELETLMPEAIFTGALKGTRLATHLASVDVFCHPGEFETFCQTIQEAFASGVPVVAPRKGGPIDLVNGTGCGYLLEPEEFAVKAVTACEDLGSRREKLSRRCREVVATRSWAHLTEQLRGHWYAAINAHAPQGATRS